MLIHPMTSSICHLPLENRKLCKAMITYFVCIFAVFLTLLRLPSQFPHPFTRARQVSSLLLSPITIALNMKIMDSFIQNIKAQSDVNCNSHAYIGLLLKSSFFGNSIFAVVFRLSVALLCLGALGNCA